MSQETPAAGGLDASSPGAAVLPVGHVVADRYRVEGVLGEGGMGVVYRVTHVLMRKPFALKVLHAAVSRSPEIVARFEREAVAAGSIDHPNVAAATDFGELPDGSFFLVSEFVGGKNLRTELEAGPMAPSRALGILQGCAAAVAAAHERGIVHRDLKPENIMLVERDGDRDFVKVIDFGIAKLAAPEQAERDGGAQPLTRVGTIMGTPDYMSPEQALGQAVDARGDLYALGVILFELLTGRCPFVGEAIDVLRQHVMEEPPALPLDVASRLDPRVPRLLRTLLAKDPAMRLQTAAELCAVLGEIRASSAAAPEHLSFLPTQAATPRPHLPPAPLSRNGAAPARQPEWTSPVSRRLGPWAALHLPGALRPHVTPRRIHGALALAALMAVVTVSFALALLLRGEPAPEPGPSTTTAGASGPPLPARSAPPAAPTPARAAASEPGPQATQDAAAPARSAKGRRTGPGGVYIPPPRTWFR